jgi:hypothetical protein
VSCDPSQTDVFGGQGDPTPSTVSVRPALDPGERSSWPSVHHRSPIRCRHRQQAIYPLHSFQCLPRHTPIRTLIRQYAIVTHGRIWRDGAGRTIPIRTYTRGIVAVPSPYGDEIWWIACCRCRQALHPVHALYTVRRLYKLCYKGLN